MPRQLTAASTLDNLKKEAKRWLKACASEGRRLPSRDSNERISSAPAEPVFATSSTRSRVEHGFEGWTRADHGTCEWTSPSVEPATLIKPDELRHVHPYGSWAQPWMRCMGCDRCRTLG